MNKDEIQRIIKEISGTKKQTRRFVQRQQQRGGASGGGELRSQQVWGFLPSIVNMLSLTHLLEERQENPNSSNHVHNILQERRRS